MRIAILGDTHFGVRGDWEVFHSYFEKFYSKFFFPALEAEGIKHVVQLGDLFDRRKFVNFQTLQRSRSYFFDPLKEQGITMQTLVGNHDSFFRNTLAVNSPDLLLGGYDNLVIHRGPNESMIDGTKVLFLPWITNENAAESNRLIATSDASIVFGHLELDGFEMYRGQTNNGGMSAKLFDRFDQVFSGHFHTQSVKGNINYLGAPCQHTWSDYDDPRGFNIFDTTTRELFFIKSPFEMFHKIQYDDKSDTDYASWNLRSYEDKFVKLIVVNKTDFLKFDKFVDRLYNVKPAELKIIENITDYDGTALGDEKIDVEDTLTMLNQYVDTIETDLNRDRLKTFLKIIYVKAQALEDA